MNFNNSDYYFPINDTHVDEEIVSLVENLRTRLGTVAPHLAIQIRKDNVDYSIKTDMNVFIQLMDDIGAIPQVTVSSTQHYSALETNIIQGMRNAIELDTKLSAPPVFDVTETALTAYADELVNNEYTRASVYYEIGRIMDRLTINRAERTKNAEAKRLYRDNISAQGHGPNGLLALRVYKYFKGKKDFLRYHGVDRFLTPATIGLINNREHESLKRKLDAAFRYI